MHEDSKQRVWIELEVPTVRVKRPLTQAEQANPANVVGSRAEQKTLMDRRAKLASQMLKRLGVEGKDRFFVMNEGDDNSPVYVYYQDIGGGIVSRMNDNGAWCNLGYLGRDL